MIPATITSPPKPSTSGPSQAWLRAGASDDFGAEGAGTGAGGALRGASGTGVGATLVCGSGAATAGAPRRAATTAASLDGDARLPSA